jgi:hypothetical protein
MAAAPNLKLIVNAETGEVLAREDGGADLREARAELARSADIIAGLQRDIRGWTIRYRELERDLAADARAHECWPIGERVFREWRRACKHPRSVWTADRFWTAAPFLSDPRYGDTPITRELLAMRAIAGAAYDCYATKRRNGSVKRHDDWDLIFRSAGKFEEFACRAPPGWTP